MITAEQLRQVTDFVKQQDLISEVVVDKLRQTFFNIHFTYCMDDDVCAANPVVESPSFNLYLIDSREHCLCFTSDINIASGIVVAEIEED